MTANAQEAAARARADAARERLMATIEETKHRLAPSTIAHNAVDGLKTRATRVAGDLRAKAEDTVGELRVQAVDGVDTVKRNPGATAAIVAVMSLVVLRKPIWRLLFQRGRQTKAEPAHLPPIPEPVPVAQAEPIITLHCEPELIREEQPA